MTGSPDSSQHMSCTQVTNCHCSGCFNHYVTNGHVSSSPEICGEACEADSNCAFSLYDAISTKCFYYDEAQYSSANITYEQTSAHEQFTCYHKAHTVAPTTTPPTAQ